MKLNKEQKQIAKKYGKYFNNTGGNEIVEFANREDISFFNNCIAAAMQSCIWSQISLIQTLTREGLLK